MELDDRISTPRKFRTWLKYVEEDWIPDRVDDFLCEERPENEAMADVREIKQRVVTFARRFIPSAAFVDAEDDEDAWSYDGILKLNAFMIYTPSGDRFKGLISMFCCFEIFKAMEARRREEEAQRKENRRSRMSKEERQALLTTGRVFAGIANESNIGDLRSALKNGIMLAKDLTPERVAAIERVVGKQGSLDDQPSISQVEEALDNANDVIEESERMLKNIKEKQMKIKSHYNEIKDNFKNVKSNYKDFVSEVLEDLPDRVKAVEAQLSARRTARFDGLNHIETS